ncbi:helix-turn-helix transcriptional regulator [Streptomyces formicae]|uniref:Regulatory protein n=1 Tax=Streptomyces formicae TaxID=1616117 RepID=A0A291QCN5_9ACTN|nr:helix-turn-helix transcriptional regulator [Streptomyces formicae]ATL29257.1 regulatory protein [Streptomyces formicae]
MSDEHMPHGADQLCETGSVLYTRAVREGRIRGGDAEPAPCLLEFGFLKTDADDARWLKPVAPAVVLPRLLRTIEDRVARHRRREEKLTATFEPFLALQPQAPSGTHEHSLITALEGFPRIAAAIEQAVAETSREALVIQPGGARPLESLRQSLPRSREILARGGRMRTLYQHTTRHDAAALSHYERLEGDVEVRTLDEVTDRLFVFDRAVAFIPVNKQRDVALRIRLPALVEYFATTFDRLWSMATPLYPRAAPQPPENGITTRQRAIAALLVEGLTDAEIATRLGMNIRTARVHIAKLAATLGSGSRTQLGYLIGQSGILSQQP